MKIGNEGNLRTESVLVKQKKVEANHKRTTHSKELKDNLRAKIQMRMF